MTTTTRPRKTRDMKEVYKLLIGILLSSVVTGGGVLWVLRGDHLEARATLQRYLSEKLAERPTNDEVSEKILREAPYSRDQKMILESLRRNVEMTDKLTVAVTEMVKAHSLLAGEVRSYIKSRGNK